MEASVNEFVELEASFAVKDVCFQNRNYSNHESICLNIVIEQVRDLYIKFSSETLFIKAHS